MSGKTRQHRTIADDAPEEVVAGRIGSGIRLPRAIERLGPADPVKIAEAKAKALAYAEQMSEDEEDEILRGALMDPDNPPLEELLEHKERKRLGRPPLPRTKRSVNLRLDQDVVDFFVKGGAGWQTRINAALRKAVGLK
jgi:uncharacterized protein (DUF4415 family)